MNTDLRTRFLSVGVFFVLIASAVFTVPARADSGSPPPAPTTPGGSSHGSSQVPSGGANTGGGDQGHKVELNNQNAAYIAPAGDPIWCPSGVAVPVPGAGGCSANYPNLYSLTNDVETGVIHPVVTNSNIWIQHGVDSSLSTMLLDGSVLPALSNVSLNFKGGWNGLGTGSVNPANPSTFTKGLKIANWQNNITLSDVQFNGITGAFPSRGVDIATKGNITLTRVQANSDWGAGAVLNTTSGNGSVTITNSQFNGDAINYDLHSLYIYSNNAVTLTNVFVNNGWGTLIDNSTGSNKPVTIKASYFDNNVNTQPNYNGLTVGSTGAISLTNVSATGNYGVSTIGGASLDNSSSIFAAPVILTGTNTFDSNAAFGLQVYSKGKITSGSINANNNGKFGASFDNSTAASALALTLTGSSTFNGNGESGLSLFSQGAITANNLIVDGNGDYGAWLDNHYSFVSPLNVTGTNGFNSNHTWGLYIDSKGAISLNNITANGNGYLINHSGLYAENYTGSSIPQKIKLTGTNNFNLNTAGAVIVASGPVTVSNVTALGNTLSNGLLIQNYWLGSTMPQSVLLLGHNLLSKNQTDNLDVETYGAITINGLTASDSVAGNGAWLGISIPVPGNITLNGINSFNNNGGVGLIIVAKGNVLTNGLNAISNTSTGVQIFNDISTAPYPVTMKGINTFNFNGALGLQVTSNGPVNINSLSTVSNSGNGAQIVNSTSLLASPVTLTGFSNFNKNGSTGLAIFSNGAVITNGLNALSNTNIGVEINNASASFSSPVTLKGLSSLNFNGSIGLELISHGTVITNGLNAQSNLSIGAEIVNTSASFNFPVTLNGVNTFNNNNSIGLEVISNGSVVTSGLNAINNNSIGAEINNSSSTLAAPVTLKGLSTFNLNSSIGLEVISNGALLTNGLIALANASSGVELNNSSTFTSPVTLKSVNFFEFNSSDGLFVISKGAVVINGANAIKNSSDGVSIDNAPSITSAPVTLMGLSTLNLNSSDGLFVLSNGTVLTNGVVARNNSSDGVFINNSGSGSSSPVTMKGLNSFSNNSSDGLFVLSKGTVLLNNVNSVNNASDGVFINNSGSGISAPVTLNGVNTLNNNTSDGLFVLSKGAITTNNLTAGFNGSAGVFMDNSTGAGAAINVKGKNITWDNSGDGMDLFSHGPVTVTNISSKLNSSDGLYVNTTGFVTVSCGNLVSNGTSHILGYGWETGSLVTLIKLIGVTTAGNFSGDSHLNGATTVITVPNACSLP